MSRRISPTLATALVRRLANPDEAVLGDLVEQFQRGKSSLWYWRQVLALIATSSLRDVRAHLILTIRGLVVAALLLRALARSLYYVVRFDEVLFSHGFRWFYVNGYGLPHWRQGQIALTCFAWVGCAVCGWIVARLHRPYGVSILIANVGLAYLWTAIVFAPNPYLTPLGVLNLVMYPIVTLSGGVFDKAAHAGYLT